MREILSVCDVTDEVVSLARSCGGPAESDWWSVFVAALERDHGAWMRSDWTVARDHLMARLGVPGVGVRH